MYNLKIIFDNSEVQNIELGNNYRVILMNNMKDDFPEIKLPESYKDAELCIHTDNINFPIFRNNKYFIIKDNGDIYENLTIPVNYNAESNKDNK